VICTEAKTVKQAASRGRVIWITDLPDSRITSCVWFAFGVPKADHWPSKRCIYGSLYIGMTQDNRCLAAIWTELIPMRNTPTERTGRWSPLSELRNTIYSMGVSCVAVVAWYYIGLTAFLKKWNRP
jgi:hypothetical protein